MQNPDVTYYPKAGIQKAVKQFETPFFLYEEEKLRENCKNFRNAFLKYFPSFTPLFAVKANANPDFLKIIMDEGFGFDASSFSEAWLAKKMNVTGMYTGNYTTVDEFEMVKQTKLIPNLDDVNMLPIIKSVYIPDTISFRINPGISKGGMDSLVVAGPNAKYGVPFEKASEVYMQAKKLGVKHFGIHMMTGSNVLDEEYFIDITAKLLEIVGEIKQNTGIDIDFLNIGGGFGVPYKPQETNLDLNRIAKGIREVFNSACAKFNIKEPILMAEPGRYIGANTGWLVSTATSIKESYKKFIGIDASANDMPRPAIYDAYHHVTVINKSKKKERVSIVGKICENNDKFAKDRLLPMCKPGDIVLIHNCGAHAYAMGHNYNGRLRHAEYLLELDGNLRQIRKPETIEDLFRNTNI